MERVNSFWVVNSFYGDVREFHFSSPDFNFISYHKDNKLLFVLDNTCDFVSPNNLLLIENYRDDNGVLDPDVKWDFILKNKFKIDPIKIRPKEDTKYKKLDISYVDLFLYSDFISNKSDNLYKKILYLREDLSLKNAFNRESENLLNYNKSTQTLEKANVTLANLQKKVLHLSKRLQKLQEIEITNPEKFDNNLKETLVQKLYDNTEKLKRTERRIKRAEKRAAVSESELSNNRLQIVELKKRISLRDFNDKLEINNELKTLDINQQHIDNTNNNSDSAILNDTNIDSDFELDKKELIVEKLDVKNLEKADGDKILIKEEVMPKINSNNQNTVEFKPPVLDSVAETDKIGKKFKFSLNGNYSNVWKYVLSVFLSIFVLGAIFFVFLSDDTPSDIRLDGENEVVELNKDNRNDEIDESKLVQNNEVVPVTSVEDNIVPIDVKSASSFIDADLKNKESDEKKNISVISDVNKDFVNNANTKRSIKPVIKKSFKSVADKKGYKISKKSTPIVERKLKSLKAVKDSSNKVTTSVTSSEVEVIPDDVIVENDDLTHNEIPVKNEKKVTEVVANDNIKDNSSLEIVSESEDLKSSENLYTEISDSNVSDSVLEDTKVNFKPEVSALDIARKEYIENVIAGDVYISTISSLKESFFVSDNSSNIDELKKFNKYWNSFRNMVYSTYYNLDDSLKSDIDVKEYFNDEYLLRLYVNAYNDLYESLVNEFVMKYEYSNGSSVGLYVEIEDSLQSLGMPSKKLDLLQKMSDAIKDNGGSASVLAAIYEKDIHMSSETLELNDETAPKSVISENALSDGDEISSVEVSLKNEESDAVENASDVVKYVPDSNSENLNTSDNLQKLALDVNGNENTEGGINKVESAPVDPVEKEKIEFVDNTFSDVLSDTPVVPVDTSMNTETNSDEKEVSNVFDDGSDGNSDHEVGNSSHAEGENTEISTLELVEN